MIMGNSNFACKVRVRSRELVNHVPKFREVVCFSLRRYPVKLVEGVIEERVGKDGIRLVVDVSYVGEVEEKIIHEGLRGVLDQNARRVERVVRRPVRIEEVFVRRVTA